MVDLVGIDVHMSYIHNLKFITLEPPSGYKRNYILMKFHTSVYLEVLNKNFLKSFGSAVGKFPLDRENGPLALNLLQANLITFNSLVDPRPFQSLQN